MLISDNHRVTVQQHPSCFVSGLLMCKPAHIAGRLTGQRIRPLKSVRASVALLRSYNIAVCGLKLFRNSGGFRHDQ